jgi:HEAT repeat protein
MHHTAKNAIAAGEKTPGLDSATVLNKFRRPLVEYLISGLEVNDKGVRILAVDMLGASGDTRAIESLKPLVIDQDPDVRMAAKKSLERICPGSVTFASSREDNCGNCMIRIIATEALEQLKHNLDPHIRQ